MQRFDPIAIESEVFGKNQFTIQSPHWGLYLGCSLVLTDEWDINDEKHAIAMNQWRDTIRPKLIGIQEVATHRTVKLG